MSVKSGKIQVSTCIIIVYEIDDILVEYVDISILHIIICTIRFRGDKCDVVVNGDGRSRLAKSFDELTENGYTSDRPQMNLSNFSHRELFPSPRPTTNDKIHQRRHHQIPSKWQQRRSLAPASLSAPTKDTYEPPFPPTSLNSSSPLPSTTTGFSSPSHLLEDLNLPCSERRMCLKTHISARIKLTMDSTG